MDELTGNQTKISHPSDSKPWLFKPGQSGNPSGKPKGTITLKEYARRYIKELSDEEKMEFMDGLPKELIWKMSEGNPKESADIKVGENTLQDYTSEEIELAKQLLNERRSKTISVEGEGTLPESVGGEVSN